jgi:SAM-dependent methyltransferase
VIESIGKLHHRYVFMRRMHALVDALGPLLAPGVVLDLGSGNGMIGDMLGTARPDVTLVGADVVIRPETFIPTVAFDGWRLPFGDDAFACVLLVDVLHHTADFQRLLREVLRVTPCVVVKDHFSRTPLDHLILRGLDWVGNAAHGVDLPYNYFTPDAWSAALEALNVAEVHRQEVVREMYPQPFQAVIGRRIQFIAKLKRLP